MAPLPVWEWRALFLDHCALDPYARLLGLVLSHKANVEDGRRIFPGMAYLMKATGGMDKRTIRDRLTLLEETGWIVRVLDGGSTKGGRRLAREWVLAVPEAARLGTPDATSPVSDGHPTDSRLGTSGARDQVHGVHGPGTWDVPPSLPSTPSVNTPAAFAFVCKNCAGTLEPDNYCVPCNAVTETRPISDADRRRRALADRARA